MKLYLLLLTLAFIQFVQGGRVRMPDEVKPAQVKEIQERKGIADDEDVAKEADKVPELKTKLRKLRKADFHGGNHATSFPPVSFSSSNQFHSSPPLPSGVYTKPFSSNSGPNSFYTQPTPPRPVSTISNQVSGSSGQYEVKVKQIIFWHFRSLYVDLRLILLRYFRVCILISAF